MVGAAGEPGFADLHLHQFGHLAFGGHVIWGDADGPVAESLASCRSLHGPHGLLDVVGNVSRATLTGGGWRALLGHRTGGHPDFGGWPRWDDLTHQAAHATMLRRAVDGGLRLVVMLAVHNELLCRLVGPRRDDCGDMAAVDLQLHAARAFEARVDEESGGPGTGWYRIVRTPAEARDAIRSGRLAVVLGIEADRIFGSHLDSGMTRADVAAAVESYHRAGVRHVLPFHFADNAFGGAAFALLLHWSTNGGIVSRTNPLGSLPAYRMRTRAAASAAYGYRGGHRNVRGLTELGHVLVDELMARGMVIDVDHMSAATRSDVLDRATDADYPVVAGHAQLTSTTRPPLRSERCLTDGELLRIRDAGGIVAPMLYQSGTADPPSSQGSSDSFARVYRHLLKVAPECCGPFGSDANGFAGLPRPRAAAPTATYPFPAPVGGAPMDRAVLGERTYDIGRDGVAHTGMLPDLLTELGVAGMTAIETAPLLRSAMHYVDTWERALARR